MHTHTHTNTHTNSATLILCPDQRVSCFHGFHLFSPVHGLLRCLYLTAITHHTHTHTHPHTHPHTHTPTTIRLLATVLSARLLRDGLRQCYTSQIFSEQKSVNDSRRVCVCVCFCVCVCVCVCV